MFVYAHWPVNGHPYMQPFHKQEKAIEHAFSRLISYVANDKRNYGNKNMPRELTLVQVGLERLSNDKTIENIAKLIALYEDYVRVANGRSSPYHEIRDVKIVE